MLPRYVKSIGLSGGTYGGYLNALYHNNVQKKERIAVMANLDLDSIGSLENGSCKDVFLKFLLKNRMFRSYDTVRRLMSTIKGR